MASWLQMNWKIQVQWCEITFENKGCTIQIVSVIKTLQRKAASVVQQNGENKISWNVIEWNGELPGENNIDSFGSGAKKEIFNRLGLVLMTLYPFAEQSA